MSHMKIAVDICYGIEPMGWHSRRRDDENWLCLDKNTTGGLRSDGSLYTFIVDFDKSKRSFNKDEVFKYMRKATIGGIHIRR